MKNKNEYKGKDMVELKTKLREKRTALRNFEFAISGSKSRNVREGRVMKKDIAKILTEINSIKK